MQGLKLLLSIMYIISPIDLVPEIAFGPIGLIDDIIALIYVIYLLITIRKIQIFFVKLFKTIIKIIIAGGIIIGCIILVKFGISMIFSSRY